MEIGLESYYLSRHPMKGSLSKSWILDSTPWIPDAGYWISVFVCGTWDSAFQSLARENELSFSFSLVLSEIPNSLSCILDSKAQDSGIHKQKFSGFRNPDSPICFDDHCGW